MREVVLTVNGRTVQEHVDDRLLLSDFLRHSLGLRGTHVGCEHGVCGACTVQLDGRAVRSCLLFAAQTDGCRVDTVEALADPEGPLSALQDAFHRHHALQCGFCTPGILMSAGELLASGGRPTRREIEQLLSGHLCRCTGYESIVDAIAEVAGERGVNLGEHLLACAERHPEALAIVDGEQRVTYAELLERVRPAAGGLAALGVVPGDRLAAALKNRIESAILYWACQWLGVVFVPLNWRLRPDELTYCVHDCGARALAIEGASAAAAEAVPRMLLIAVADAAAGQPLELAEGPEAPSQTDEREPALMLYTSGTTGRPKGVPRSHRAERAAALAQLVQLQLRPGDRTLGVMPLYHTMGMRSLLAASACGGVFCSQPEFRAEAALAAVERERLTSLYLAPTLFHDMVAAQRERPRDLSSVRALAYAGAPMTGVLVERCVEAFAPEAFVNHYGSTEIYTFTIHSDQRAKPGCAGRAALNARIRLVEPVSGASPEAEAAPGEIGQVACALSSDEAFSGYWQRPDADERQIRDGWYFPGDLGRLDADGDLYLVGRMDDMIISGGENVHPLEIEEWLVRYPGVDEAAVVGEADERLGQRVVAFVVSSVEVTAEALDAHCLASPTLARFKRPRDYRFVDALPKSASGKLLRRMLRTTEGTT